MKGDLKAARRYAAALFGLARDTGALDRVASDLAILGEVTRDDASLLRVLGHPRIPLERKKTLLHEVFAATLGTEMLRFLELLLANERAALLPSVIREYGRLMDEYRHEIDVYATTAVPLEAAQEAALREKLATETGARIRLHKHIDPAILGGLVLRLGDHLLDGSAATRLRNLRENLQRAKVT